MVLEYSLCSVALAWEISSVILESQELLEAEVYKLARVSLRYKLNLVVSNQEE